MTSFQRFNRTYTTSAGTVPAYPYGGHLSPTGDGGSGVDHAGCRATRLIGAGSPTGTDDVCTREKREEVHPTFASSAVGRAPTHLPVGDAHEDEGRMMRPVNEKDRCANTGPFQGSHLM